MCATSQMVNKIGLGSAAPAGSSFTETDNNQDYCCCYNSAKKQGIVSILSNNNDVVAYPDRAARARGAATAASLRRTLSADMSSKKWLAQNGFSPTPTMKKIASSEELSAAITIPDTTSSQEEEEGGEFSAERNRGAEKGGQFDIWSAIVSEKARADEASKSAASPPYIHPLVKRSASTLSENSLKICTESLGSETGSDGFSSYPASVSGSDVERDENDDDHHLTATIPHNYIAEDGEEVVGGGGGGSRKSAATAAVVPPRSFPPPISSLSQCSSYRGESLRMQTRRHNGRLVVEAVSVPCSKRNFRAQRHGGRLVLTFLGPTSATVAAQEEIDRQVDELDEKSVNFDNEEKEEEEEEIDEEEEEDEAEEIDKQNGIMREIGIEMEEEEAQKVPVSPRVINFHRLAVMMSNNKPIGEAGQTKFNESPPPVELEEEKEEEEEEEEIDDGHYNLHLHEKKKKKKNKHMVPTAQSLPPRPPPPPPPAAVAASFNAYEYCWRGNSTPTAHHVALRPLRRNTNTLVISKNELIMSDGREGLQNERSRLVVLRGNKTDNLVPLLKGCKNPTTCTPLLFWETRCIATS